MGLAWKIFRYFEQYQETHRNENALIAEFICDIKEYRELLVTKREVKKLAKYFAIVRKSTIKQNNDTTDRKRADKIFAIGHDRKYE